MTESEFKAAVIGKNVYEDLMFEFYLGAGGSDCSFDCILKGTDDEDVLVAMASGILEVDDDGKILSVGEIVFRDYCDMNKEGFVFEDAEIVDPDDFMWFWVWDALAEKFSANCDDEN